MRPDLASAQEKPATASLGKLPAPISIRPRELISAVPQNAKSSSGTQPDAQSWFTSLTPLGYLGSGSTSSVRLAQHAATGEFYAIKSTPSFSGSETQLMALRELQVLRESKSRHLTQLHETYMRDGRIHFVLEWMSVGSLDALLTRGVPVPPYTLGGILYQVLRGLAYLHTERQMMHRDLKPANILLDVRGIVKLSDFGIATERLSFTKHSSCASAD